MLLFTVLLHGYALVHSSTSRLCSCSQFNFTVMLLFTVLLRHQLGGWWSQRIFPRQRTESRRQTLAQQFTSRKTKTFLTVSNLLCGPIKPICYSLHVYCWSTSNVAQKVMPHFFFSATYSFRMYEIHTRYNWMFPLHM